MNEIKGLPVLNDWVVTPLKNEYKLFRRKDGSLILQIVRSGMKEISIQADLDYVIDEYVRMENKEFEDADFEEMKK